MAVDTYLYKYNLNLTMQKKSQNAMESIMTYGWVILVVIVVIAALVFFGVLDIDMLFPDKITVSDKRIKIFPTESNRIIVKNLGEDTFKNMTINFTSLNCIQTTSRDIMPGKTEKFLILCDDVSDKTTRLKSDLTIKYNLIKVGETVSHVTSGHASIKGDYFSSKDMFAYYPGEKDTNDFSRQDNDGTMMSGTFGEGISGKGFVFDGENDYVDVPFTEDFDIEGRGLSIALWVKAREPIVQDQKFIAKKKSEAYGLEINYDGAIGITIINKSGSYAIVHQSGFYDNYEDEWTFVVGTYDGKDVSLYINGEFATSAPFSGEIDSDDTPFQIGGNSIVPEASIEGNIDEVMLFHRKLSSNEIKNMYRAIKI